MESLIESCYEDAKTLGMDLNYSPKRIGDESKMSNEEWLEMRRGFIGGSNAGVTLGYPSYSSSRTSVAMSKRGLDEDEEIDPDTQFLFDTGHAMEPVIAKKFALDMGFTVFPDTGMYVHPLFPFMGADADFLCIDHEGYKNGVEIKTTNSNSIRKWKSGVYGENAVVHVQSYIAQCQHYMAVFNIFRWWLVIAVPGDARSFVIIRVDRDMLDEKELISAEKEFWEEWVTSPEMPREETFTYAQYEKIKPGESEKRDAPTILPAECQEDIDRLIDLASRKSELNTQLKSLCEAENALKLRLISALKGNEAGVFEVDEDSKYEISYRPNAPKETLDTDKLSALEPELLERLRIEGVLKKSENKPVFRIRACSADAGNTERREL